MLGGMRHDSKSDSKARIVARTAYRFKSTTRKRLHTKPADRAGELHGVRVTSLGRAKSGQA